MTATPSVGLGGHVLRGQDNASCSGLRSRLASALASPGLSRAAAIGNLAALACIGLSLMPKATSDLSRFFAGMTDPAQAVMPWLLAPLVVTSAIASVMLLISGRNAAQQRPAPQSVALPIPHSDPRHDLRLDRIGHELRTPLTAIIGFSDMMQSELHGPLGCDRYQCYAGHIRESGVTLLQAIEVAITAADAQHGATVNEDSRRA